MRRRWEGGIGKRESGESGEGARVAPLPPLRGGARLVHAGVEVVEHRLDVVEELREAGVVLEGLEQLLPVQQRVHHLGVAGERVGQDRVHNLQHDAQKVRVDVQLRHLRHESIRDKRGLESFREDEKR
eukprot:1184597-Prorocentrum_minimum.AAC.3